MPATGTARARVRVIDRLKNLEFSLAALIEDGAFLQEDFALWREFSATATRWLETVREVLAKRAT